MKYCTECGAELFDEAIMCPKCKKMINESSKKLSSNNHKTTEITLPQTISQILYVPEEMKSNYSFFETIVWSFKSLGQLTSNGFTKSSKVTLTDDEIVTPNRNIQYIKIKSCFARETKYSIYGSFVSAIIVMDNETISLVASKIDNSEILKIVDIINSKIRGE